MTPNEARHCQAETREGESRGRAAAVGLALLLVVVFLAFAPILGNGFVAYDDEEYLVDNPHVRNGLTAAGLQWAFTTDWAANWHPLTWITHQADAEVFGLRPFGHHLTTLLLHVLNTALLFLILRIATGTFWRSIFVAAIFGLHPLQVESVAWATERKNVLCALFMLLSILAYLRYARAPGVLRFLVVAGLFALALLSKPMAVTLPFVLLLLDFWPLRRAATLARLVGEKALLLPLTAGSIVVTVLAQASFGAVVSVEEIPVLLRLQNTVLAYGAYLGKFVWPVDLAIPYMHWRDPAVALVALAAAVLLAVSAAAVHLRRRAPWLLFGWLFFLGTLVPVIGIVKVGAQGIADRYMYLSIVGIAVMLTFGVADLTGRLADAGKRRKWRSELKWVAGGGCVALALLTAVQAGRWKDTPTLFGHTLELHPENPVALGILGGFHLKHGSVEKAAGYLERWTRAAPDSPEAWNNRGVSLLRLGRPADAIPGFERAVELNPAYFMPKLNLGVAYRDLGRPGDSAAILLEACDLRPDDYRANLEYGRTLLALGRRDEALERLRAADDLAPGSVDIPAEMANYR